MVLKLENIPSGFDGFRLLLIVSNLKDYQLAHFINIGVGLPLKKYDDIPYATNLHNQRYYSWFHFTNKEYNTKYYLVENRSNGKYLFASLKKIDYLLFIKNAVSENTINNLTQKLRNIRGINAVFGHEISVLKNIQLFFDEMELHELEQVIKPSKEITYRQLRKEK